MLVSLTWTGSPSTLDQPQPDGTGGGGLEFLSAPSSSGRGAPRLFQPPSPWARGPLATDRQAAVESLVQAAGGKVVAMYGTAANGPGAMVIFDVSDPDMASDNGRRCCGRSTRRQ